MRRWSFFAAFIVVLIVAALLGIGYDRSGPSGKGWILLDEHPGGPRWSEDGKTLFYVRYGIEEPKVLVLCQPSTKRKRLFRLPPRAELLNIDVSPDGTRIVSLDLGGILVWDFEKRHCAVIASSCSLSAVYWLDNTKILFSSASGGVSDIYLVNADGSGQHKVASNALLECASPDRKGFIFERGDKRYRFDLATSQSKLLPPVGPIKPEDHVSPDGRFYLRYEGGGGDWYNARPWRLWIKEKSPTR